MTKKAEVIAICNTLIDVVDKLENEKKGSVDKQWLESNLRQLESLVQSDNILVKYFKGVGYRTKSRQEEKSIQQFTSTLTAIQDMMVMIHRLENLPDILLRDEERRRIIEDLELRKMQLEVEKLELEVQQEKLAVERLLTDRGDDEDY